MISEEQGVMHEGGGCVRLNTKVKMIHVRVRGGMCEGVQ